MAQMMTAGITGESITGDAYDRSEGDIDEECGYAEFTFNTAWAPADGIYNAIREKYPDVGISWFYDEPGCELAGYLPD